MFPTRPNVTPAVSSASSRAPFRPEMNSHFTPFALIFTARNVGLFGAHRAAIQVNNSAVELNNPPAPFEHGRNCPQLIIGFHIKWLTFLSAHCATWFKFNHNSFAFRFTSRIVLPLSICSIRHLSTRQSVQSAERSNGLTISNPFGSS